MAHASLICAPQETCTGDNQFVEHETVGLQDALGRIVAKAMVTLFDGQQAHAMHTATRWLTTPFSYLSNHASYLFDSREIVATLPEMIRLDIGKPQARVIFLDDLFTQGVMTDTHFADLAQSLMVQYRDKADIMILPNMPVMMSRLGLSLSNAMDSLARIGIMPLDGMAFIGFMEDLDIFDL